MSWEDFINEVNTTTRTKETLKQYFSYSKEKQDEIKDVGGFVGGYIKGGRRVKGAVETRRLVTLDVDHCSSLEVWESFKLLGYAGCMYTTHKHRPEAPRYRLIFPLSEKVGPELYEAIGRSVAEWLGIDNFDDTTYQAERLMYWPSTSKDAEFLFNEVDGEWLSPEEAVADLEDWKDPTCWPVSSRIKESIRTRTSDKVEPPEEKDGVIGAFCRAFSMSIAIAEFVEDYQPSEDGRYSYTGGTTTNGVVIYNDNLSYSHHSTDPAGGRLCNTFDLVRIHKFGDLDTEEKTDITKQPSYRAMIDFASKLKAVKREILASRKHGGAEDYDTLEDEAIEAATSEEWLEGLDTERNGDTKNTIANVVLILNNDQRLAGRFGFNEFDQRETAIKALPWDAKGMQYPRALIDADDAQLRLYLERLYNITGKGQIQDGLTVVVRNNTYHPIKDYLNSLNWDGIERLDELFINVLGANDSPYIRAVTRKVFVAAVARIFFPGIKFDQITVILGPQGIGKSLTLQRMGMRWFSDSLGDLKSKDAFEGIQGSWIIEIAELAGMKKADVETVKHFVSKTEDKFRVAYGKRSEQFPRRCVLFGTTNEDEFLKDVTGNRRFWVINTLFGAPFVFAWDYLTPDIVGQLWAEALYYFKAGEPLILPSSLEGEARLIQDAHLEKDERLGLVTDYLERLLPTGWDDLDIGQRRNWLSDDKNAGTVERKTVCLMELWAECLGRDPSNISRTESYFLSRVLKSVRGWTSRGKSQRFKLYGVQKTFERN